MPLSRILLALGASILSGIATAQIAPPPGGMGVMGALMRADANHDGVTTREEVVASADSLFARLDANHDGTVTPDEITAMRPMRGGGGLPPPPAATAGRTPATGAMEAPGAPMAPAGPVARSFTRQQWHDRALAQFDRVDANHDGKVDQAEMQAYRDMMRERRQERRGGDMAPPPPGQ